jgi:hypothetical protein
VMRDGDDTCITICNMENFDPMGVHTTTPLWSRRRKRSPTRSTRCSARQPWRIIRARAWSAVQRSVRARPDLTRLRRRRGQPARESLLGARLEATGPPDRPRRPRSPSANACTRSRTRSPSAPPPPSSRHSTTS